MEYIIIQDNISSLSKLLVLLFIIVLPNLDLRRRLKSLFSSKEMFNKSATNAVTSLNWWLKRHGTELHPITAYMHGKLQVCFIHTGKYNPPLSTHFIYSNKETLNNY